MFDCSLLWPQCLLGYLAHWRCLINCCCVSEWIPEVEGDHSGTRESGERSHISPTWLFLIAALAVGPESAVLHRGAVPPLFPCYPWLIVPPPLDPLVSRVSC